MSEAELIVRCEGVSKRFRRAWVLDEVELRLERGSMLGLIGPGGCGKSLLVKMICGLVRPDRGRIWVNGQELGGLGERQMQALRAQIGMVFQNYALFDFLDVGENIALPLRVEGLLPPKEIEQRVAEILDLVALPGIERKMPHELSGGMKKRVSFARAVVRRPPLVIYDDPTAGLDPVTSAKIYRLLARMKEEGTSSITISHDLDGIRPLCERWLLLDGGRKLFEGDLAALEACSLPRVREFWHGD